MYKQNETLLRNNNNNIYKNSLFSSVFNIVVIDSMIVHVT